MRGETTGNTQATMSRRLARCSLVWMLVAGCASTAPAPVPPQPVLATAAPVPVTPQPEVTNKAAQPESLYTLDEAFADVMATPLAFIGTGEWYGDAPYPPCAYKNDRVLVLDQYCTTNKG